MSTLRFEMATRVVYLHGLESGPQAGKVLALRASGFEVVAPSLDTEEVQALRAAGSRLAEAYARAMDRPVQQAVDAITTAAPDVIVGSSFGAAVLLRILHQGVGGHIPVVLLAQAGVRLTGYTALPQGVSAVLMHGRQDEVVPIEDSRLLAASSAAAVLIEVHDDHRLTQSTRNGLLASVVALAAARKLDSERSA